MTIRIAMWSGPRNISTAMLRSWENRLDTTVVDEPFYAYYLNRSRSTHPGFTDILASQSSCYDDVAYSLSEQLCESAIQFQKQMTHHLYRDNDLQWTAGLKHVFLVREPAEIVSSYTTVRGNCELHDIGVEQQLWLYDQITAISGQDIPIIDASDVLRNPARLLRKLCERLDVPFSEKMLNWPAGKRDSDGVWAPHWYGSVEASTEFKAYEKSEPVLDFQQREVVEQAMPYFLPLHCRRLRTD